MRQLSFAVAAMAAFLSLPSVQTVAQTPLERDDRHTATLLSPYYFGPNAFPVPDMNDGTVLDELRIELDAEYEPGYRGDRTADIYFCANIPLFTDRANLSIWMNTVEWYRNSDRSIKECRLSDAVDKYNIRNGHTVGDAYVSVDILVVKEREKLPSLTLRSVLKSASDDGWHLGRYYDSPGYFFDSTLGKSFSIGSNASLRTALQGGFLCWQTNNGRQNDAVMYGLMARLNLSRFFITAAWSGYSGWEHHASNGGDKAHDRPMVLRSELGYRIGNIEFDASYQYGARDYPYHRIRAGIVWYWDILNRHGL